MSLLCFYIINTTCFLSCLIFDNLLSFISGFFFGGGACRQEQLGTDLGEVLT